jgi:hypothetical protein
MEGMHSKGSVVLITARGRVAMALDIDAGNWESAATYQCHDVSELVMYRSSQPPPSMWSYSVPLEGRRYLAAELRRGVVAGKQVRVLELQPCRLIWGQAIWGRWGRWCAVNGNRKEVKRSQGRSMETRWTASSRSDYLSPISLRYVVFTYYIRNMRGPWSGRS